MVKSNIESVIRQLENRYEHLAKIKDALDLNNTAMMYGEYREYYMIKKRILDVERPAVKPGLVKVQGENAGAIMALNALTLNVDSTMEQLEDLKASMNGGVRISGNRQYDEDRLKRTQTLKSVEGELSSVVKALVSLKDIRADLDSMNNEDILPSYPKHTGLFRNLFRIPDTLELELLELEANTYSHDYSINVHCYYYRNGRKECKYMYTSDIRRRK